jgi:raffinose/stachyose/melibiose transport system substrate-binding protein
MSFLSWYAQDQYQPILDAFKALYPNISIDFQNVPAANNAYGQRLQLLASSGELPDLFYVQPPTTVMAKNGYLADLSGLDVIKALPPAYTASYTYDNKIYSYAPDAWVGGVFYNKALFKENNLAVPQTWADFVAAAKVFHSKGIIPISMGSDELVDLLYWLHNTEVLSADPQFDVKINTGQTTFTQGYLAALNTWKKDMLDTGYITQDMTALADDQRMTQFATGQAAMTISGPWAVNSLKQKNPNLDLGIFPFVGTTPSKVYTVGAVNVGLSISSKAQNKAAAEAFLSFLGSPQGLTLYQKMTGNFLGVKGISYKIDPVMAPMQQYAENGRFAYPPIDWTFTGTLAPMVVKGMQQLVLGVETPEQLVKDLDAKQADLASNQK